MNLRLLPAFLVAVLVCSCATAVEKAPIAEQSAKAAVEAPDKQSAPALNPAEQFAKLHIHRVHFSSRSSNQHRKGLKLPEAADAMCSAFNSLAGKGIKACITRSDKKGKWESIVIDMNGNKDLTDDPPRTLPAKGAEDEWVLECGGKKHMFKASCQQNRNYVSLALVPTTCISGKTAMGDDTIDWIACDCNLSGSLDAGDTAYLDMNANAKFADRGVDERLLIGPTSTMYRDNKWFSITAASADNSINIGPYEGPTHKLSMDHSAVVSRKDATHDLSVYLPDGRSIKIAGVDASAGLSLPPGTYRYISGTIKKESGQLSYYTRNLKLAKDEELVLHKPEVKISVSQKGDKISVGQKIVTPNSVTYRTARAKPGPLVEVFSGEGQKDPIAKGNMAYG